MIRSHGERRSRVTGGDDDNLPEYFRPKHQRREDSPPSSLQQQQQQNPRAGFAPSSKAPAEVRAEVPLPTNNNAVSKPRGFRFSPPRRGPPQQIQQRQKKPEKPLEARGFGREPPAFEPAAVAQKLQTPAPSAAAAATPLEGEKEKVHWKDVHGIKMEAILELDKQVRRCRFKPSDNLLAKIEYTLEKFMTEQYLSTRGMARALYKGGVKSIWIMSPAGNLGFMLEDAYVRGHPGGVEGAFERLRLPENDGSTGVEGGVALETGDAALTASVRQMMASMEEAARQQHQKQQQPQQE